MGGTQAATLVGYSLLSVSMHTLAVPSTLALLAKALFALLGNLLLAAGGCTSAWHYSRFAGGPRICMHGTGVSALGLCACFGLKRLKGTCRINLTGLPVGIYADGELPCGEPVVQSLCYPS